MVDIIRGFREALQDLLVPEIRALRSEVASQGQAMRDLRAEMNERFAKVDQRFEALHREMNERFAKVDQRFEALHREMNERFAKVDERFERLYHEMATRFEQHATLIARMDARLDSIVDLIREISDKLDVRDDVAALKVDMARLKERVGV